jgi:predicted peptidase
MTSSRKIATLLTLNILSTLQLPQAQSIPPTGFLPLTTTIDSQERAGAVYLPENYDYESSKKYPLIVFLHGSGEKGNDGEFQTTVGIGKEIRENPERFPCIVYMPQCPTDDHWAARELGGDGTSANDHILQGIAEIQKRYSIDKKRISLTGLSMGGAGTFALGAKHPELFSAFIPICGKTSKRNAKALAKNPTWIFHGEADTVNPASLSDMIYKAIKEEGGDVQLTLYHGIGHNSWDKAYSKEQGAIEWLLKQKR